MQLFYWLMLKVGGAYVLKVGGAYVIEHSGGFFSSPLTHLCLASHTSDTGKQCRPRSDATECGHRIRVYIVCIEYRNF